MIRALKSALGAALAAFLLSSSAAGAAHQARQLLCRTSTTMKTILKDQWGERPVASGLLTGGRFVIVWYANAATGTWSIVRFTPTGLACLLGAGDSFNPFKKTEPKKDKPA